MFRKGIDDAGLLTSSWLTGWEQDAVIEGLLNLNLIKFDNARKLPLKNGGDTDIYINLRNARNAKGAIDFVAKVFSHPLKRLGAKKFAEVPDSVSCFAPKISEETGLLYVTIRETAKGGRATAQAIGEIKRGEEISIIDDVITDGASKLEPYKYCVSQGAHILPLVVLVDRQRGWKKKFQELGIDVGVWAGMTLHDVRRYLIIHGIMERCNPDVEKKNPIIIALDGKSWEEMLLIIDPLRTTGCILKVNDLVFNEGIKNLIPNLQTYGRVMVDLKSHDIENTVANTMQHLLQSPPWAVTVHASGGEKMIKAAVQTLAGTSTMVLPVTVLTSFNAATCEEIYVRQPMEQVLKLAEIVNRAGAHGLVCSPLEVPELKRLYPNMVFVTPGIRSPGVNANEQERVATPAGARENGSSYIVMGRQLLEVENTGAEVKRVLKEELKIT